jgi:hypothetical protein
MELHALQGIADGTVSLAELERQHPIIGRNFNDFVTTVNRCCRDAYERFSSCLDDVLTLPIEASETRKAAVLKKLRGASDSKWFRDVARICDDLAAVANTYDEDIRKHAEQDSELRHEEGWQKRFSLMNLLMILHRHEGDLKQDIRQAVDYLKVDVTDGRIADARQRALTIKDEIDRNLTRINGVAVQIAGSAADGANEVLTKEQIAEAALRRPERVLVFNMAAVAVLLILGAAALQYVSLIEFPLLTGFVLTAVIVINAFYLKGIDKLQDEPFLELMKLALLKFFAPLAHQRARAATNRRQTSRPPSQAA